MSVTQLDKGDAFLALHRGPRAFILANAWDAGSARILAGLGFSAIGTSSWASANVYGRRDHAITREQSLAHARAIACATDLPVSADLESGFGASPSEVAETYRQAAAAGLVGATIEDATPGHNKDNPLFDIGEATERVAAAVEATRKLGFPFLLTARAEGFLRDNTNLDDAIRRLQAYEKAGADVLMAPGLPDLNSVKAVCAAIGKPFNFMVVLRPGTRGGRRTPHQPRQLALSRRDGRAGRGGAGGEGQGDAALRRYLTADAGACRIHAGLRRRSPSGRASHAAF
jgi:2-methylisocitrate lyase-like PEP mutase family enzyme